MRVTVGSKIKNTDTDHGGGKIERMRHENKAVGPYRVWLDDEGPGISVTRSLGDWITKKIGIISEPEV